MDGASLVELTYQTCLSAIGYIPSRVKNLGPELLDFGFAILTRILYLGSRTRYIISIKFQYLLLHLQFYYWNAAPTRMTTMK